MWLLGVGVGAVVRWLMSLLAERIVAAVCT
jgi:hypothetical protein